MVCGRAKSAPGGAAAPRVVDAPRAAANRAAPGPLLVHRPVAGTSSSTGSPRGRPAVARTAHDPRMHAPAPAARRRSWLARPAAGALAAVARPRRRCRPSRPGRGLAAAARARGGRAGSTRRTHPWGSGHRGVDLLGTPGQAGARRAGRHGDLRRACSPAAAWSSSTTATPGPPTSRSTRHGRGRRSGRPRRGRSARLQARRLALPPAGLPALGLAARRDLPRPARPGRRRPGAAAAALARRARAPRCAARS